MPVHQPELEPDPMDRLLSAEPSAPRGAEVPCTASPPFDAFELIAYQRTSLPQPERFQRVEAHLVECRRCRDFLVENGRVVAREREQRVRRLVAGVAAVASVGAIVLALAGAPRPVDRPSYRVAQVYGTELAVRGSGSPEPPREPWRLHGSSRLRVLLEPTREDARGPAEVGAFVVDGDARLEPIASARFSRRSDAGFLSFELTGSGRELFGAKTRRGTLVLAVSASHDRLSKLGGQRVAEARMDGELQLIEQPFDYTVDPRE